MIPNSFAKALLKWNINLGSWSDMGLCESLNHGYTC